MNSYLRARTLVHKILVIGTLAVALRAPQSRVPSFPRLIVFVIGTNTPRYEHTNKGDFSPMTNYDVIKYADVTDVIARVGDTCRCVRWWGGTCVCFRYSGA